MTRSDVGMLRFAHPRSSATENPRDLVLRSALFARVSKDGQRAAVRGAILRDAMLRTAPQDEVHRIQNNDACPSSFLRFAARRGGTGSGCSPSGAMTSGESFAVRFTAVEIS
jgi:hypothetical protein